MHPSFCGSGLILPGMVTWRAVRLGQDPREPSPAGYVAPRPRSGRWALRSHSAAKEKVGRGSSGSVVRPHSGRARPSAASVPSATMTLPIWTIRRRTLGTFIVWANEADGADANLAQLANWLI